MAIPLFPPKIWANADFQPWPPGKRYAIPLKPLPCHLEALCPVNLSAKSGTYGSLPISAASNAAVDAMLEAARDGADAPGSLGHQEPQQGHLPAGLREAFEELFGIEYLSEAMMDFVSHDPLPAWAQRSQT